jgi:NAD-dependent deacetylase
MELPAGLIELLHHSRKILVLTGAGMSAESGVPTFRDAQTGLWSRFRPEDLATPQAFREHPRLVWDWYAERRANIRKVRPHAGHFALAGMERHFESMLIATQNVDGLHQRAGSARVVELHGNIMRSICSETGQPIEDSWIEANPGHPPLSPHHNEGFARPAVVWFGELLPEGAMERSATAALECDACLSIGTSTLVQPAASLPFIALRSGSTVIEINPSPTALSELADFSLRATAANALTAIAAGLARVK